MGRESRERLQIVSKVGICLKSRPWDPPAVKMYDYSREHVSNTVKNSLRDVGVPCLDALLFHRPSPLLDPGSLAATCDELRRAGFVKRFGVSNFLPHHMSRLSAALERVGISIWANQVQLSPLQLEAVSDGTLDYCAERGIHVMAWGPFGAC